MEFSELWIVVWMLKYYMYACAVATWSLRLFLPSPDEIKSIFGIQVAPHRYLVFYNLMRWVSGNKSWVIRNGDKKDDGK